MKAHKIFHRMVNGWFLPAATDRDGFGSCDIYISYLDKNGWSEAYQSRRPDQF